MPYHCDICSNTIEDKLKGHFFDQNRVLTSPGYWMHLYTKAQIRLTEDGIGGYLAMFCQDTSGYIVCDQCQNMLAKDVELAKEYTIETSISSIPSGQVDTLAAGTVAGTVWQKLNGSWPSTIQLGGGGTTGKLRVMSNKSKGGFLGFIKKLFSSKDAVVENASSEVSIDDSLDTLCDKLMAKHVAMTDGILTSMAMTIDVLLKEHQLSEDEAKSVIVRWGQRNKP